MEAPPRLVDRPEHVFLDGRVGLAVPTEAGPALVWHHALYGLPLTDELPARILALVLPPEGSLRG